MPIDPQAQKVLDQLDELGLPPNHTISPEEARTNLLSKPRPKGPEVDKVEDRIIANGDFLAGNRAAVAAFVKVTQKAFHACAVDAGPCIQALVTANKGLKASNETPNWGLVKELMTDEISTGVGLGYMDPDRMAKSYKIFESFLAKPFDVTKHYTNEFIDPEIGL